MQPFLAILIAGMLSRLGYQMARSPVLPRFAQDLGAAPELLGLIVAASTITGIFIKLPAGALSDVLGKKRMMLVGCLFFVLPPFLYPFVTGPYALLLLRFLHGFATAIFAPVASAYVASLAEEGRGAKLGWFTSATDIGATVGPLAGGMVLFATAGSYTATYLLVGLLGILPLLMVLRLPEPQEDTGGASETLASRSRRFREGLAEVLSSPPVIIASALEAIMYVGYGAFLGFLPIYGKAGGLNDAQIALVLGCQLATAMAAKPLTGWLSDRMGRKPVILAGLLLCAAALPLLFRAEGFGPLAGLSLLLGLGVAAVTPCTTALVADLVKAGRMGSAMGVFGTIWDAGESAGPILAGFLIARAGYGRAFDLIALLMLAAAAVFALAVRDPAPPAGGPSACRKGGRARPASARAGSSMRDRTIIYCTAFLRSMGIGMASVLLALYLVKTGHSAFQVGMVIAAGLGGMAAAMLFVSLCADRLGRRAVLVGLSLFAFAGSSLVVAGDSLSLTALGAFLGMLSGSGMDRGAIYTLEQAILPSTAPDERRTMVFAGHGIALNTAHALGALLGGVPPLLRAWAGMDDALSFRCAIAVYPLMNLLAALLYTRLSPAVEETPAANGASGLWSLTPRSRRIVVRFSVLSSVDSLGGAFLPGALLSYWFFRRFGAEEGAIGVLFAVSHVLTASSYIAAAWLSRRIGLVNTMVFTHIPSNLLLASLPFMPSFPAAVGVFLAREFLSQMDVPTRQSYMVAIVGPGERSAATGITNLTRGVVRMAGPSLSGYLMGFVSLSAPLFISAGLKTLYDGLLYREFRAIKP
ncbi:MAG: MFS transporter, partial [Candidatus Tectomicrobia bacterium]|nr:MFS transporter [Candidatus Tectomicrobia bacterium]